MTTPTAIRRLRHQTDLEDWREDNPHFAGTLAKGLMILQCFVTEPRPHANSELSDKLGIPRPTVTRLCQTLQALGYLDHDARLDRYFIGPAAVALGYPYVIATPLLAHIRPAMQALALSIEGAVSVGVTIDLDVIYIESMVHEQGTLMRPAVGAVRGVVETAMGRAWLGSLNAEQRRAFLARVEQARPQEIERCRAGLQASLATLAQHGFSTNYGDSGYGVHAVGVASRIPYGSRQLLFNCAVPGHRLKPKELVQRLGPRLVDLVAFAERQNSLR
ncbi:MAG: IclR family transcriptional regulator [Ideonella sp. MAG2]|nr:MAG: IclR family transcriptional regulator [Ideonella sp. MAG2]